MTEKISAYIAFQGGGALGMAHLGAWKAVSQQFNIKGVAGTSAGSIVAAFCAAGFSPEHTIDIFSELDWSRLIKRQNLLKLMIKKDGFSDGENFHKWLRDKLRTYIINNDELRDISFDDLYNATKIYLAIVACDLNEGRSIPVVFDKDKRSDYFVSSAVRASISIPGFFTPKRTDKGETLVDGGLLLNYPIELLYEQAQQENCALIGVRFKEQRNFIENPTAWQTFWKSVQVMQQVGNQPSDKITKYPKYIEIAIDVQDFNFLDFDLARNEKEELVKRETQATQLALYEHQKKRGQPVVVSLSQSKSKTETQTHLNSDFYVKRDPYESGWYEEILQPGTLLRIKAPLQMGKTLLMSKILKHAEQHGYRTVALNLRDSTKEDFSNLDKFLQWFCTSTTVMLGLTHPVNEHWSESLGNSKIKCRTYFEKYLLPSDRALVLALDEVDRLFFPYPEIAGEFLGMLRTWYEDAKTRQVWKQLRQIVLYTEVYTQLDINQSPFNAGMEIKLTDFSQEQVQVLAQQYRIDWSTGQIKQLMDMVGGHPYLVSTALKQVVQQHMTLEQLLQSVFSEVGIYRDHLRRHWKNLQRDSQLATAFKKIVIANTGMGLNSELNRDIAVQLNDLGLVSFQNDSVIPRYELYRQYFRSHLGDNT
jgi:predicted acylesterase/phospholipase RssA